MSTLPCSSCFLRRCAPFALLWTLVCIQVCQARAETLRIDNAPATTKVNLTPYWSVLEDPNQQLTIDDVSKPESAARFHAPKTMSQRHATDSLNFGISKSAFWLKATLQNTAGTDLERRLEVAYPHLRYVDLYVPDGRGFRRIASGHSLRFSARPVNHKNLVFPLYLPARSESTVYLRVESSSSLEVPTRLWQTDAFEQYNLHEYMGQALYFGMLLALCLYNFLLFVSIRDKTYFYYVLFTLAAALSLIAYSGMGDQFLWPDARGWAKIASMIGFAANGLTLLLFQRRLLSTSTTVPVLDRVMLGFIALNVLQMIGFWWSYEKVIKLGIAIDGLNMTLVLIVAIACLLRGQRSARVFLLAFSCLVIAALLTAIGTLGMGIPSFVTTYGMQIGSTVEMLLLSLALADRFNQIRREKEAAQEQFVVSLKRSERVLELRVADRTAELSAINAELVAQERALAAGKKVAEEASRMKSVFLANMSHEIRTPMNAVIGMAYLALRTELTAKQRDYVEKIRCAAMSLLGIVNDILDFSKIEAGKLDIERIDFSLNEVLANVSAVTAQRAQEKDLRYHFDIAEDVPVHLIGDPIRLGQVLINLMNNAIKFTEEGEVKLTCHTTRVGGRTIALHFCVHDTGIGLTPDEQRKLFQAFTQADGSITRKFGGTGLGLTISKRLVEMMGGAISLQSEPGVGSVFSFSIHVELSTLSDKPALTLPDGVRGRRVLIVDDNPAAREILIQLLEGFRLQVDAQASGAEALAAIRQADRTAAYDVVLADLGMPGMSGLELATAIAQDGLANTPKTILITAFGREDVIRQAENAPIATVLFKPIDQSLLHDTLLDVLAQDAVPRSPGRQGRPVPNLQGCKLLLVEDNGVNREIAREMLAVTGAQLDIAENGRIAVDMLLAAGCNAYDLVLMDIQMPEMSGHAATQRLRLEPDFAHLPILAMTAHATVEERERCVRSGMQGYITKPIDPDEFYQTVARWLQRDILCVKPADAPGDTVVSAGVVAPVMIPGFNTVETLVRLDGDVALYHELLEILARSLATTLAQFDMAHDRGALEAMRSAVHNIRGMAANVGAASLSASAARVEHALHDNQATAAHFNAFRAEVAGTLQAVQVGLTSTNATMQA